MFTPLALIIVDASAATCFEDTTFAMRTSQLLVGLRCLGGKQKAMRCHILYQYVPHVFGRNESLEPEIRATTLVATVGLEEHMGGAIQKSCCHGRAFSEAMFARSGLDAFCFLLLADVAM